MHKKNAKSKFGIFQKYKIYCKEVNIKDNIGFLILRTDNIKRRTEFITDLSGLPVCSLIRYLGRELTLFYNRPSYCCRPLMLF